MFGASGLRGLKYVAEVATGKTEMFGTTELLVLLVGTITAFLVSLAVIPVSYTHLDVYKRQVYRLHPSGYFSGHAYGGEYPLHALYYSIFPK